MPDYNIRVTVDPTKAERGARRVDQALDRTGTRADVLRSRINRAANVNSRGAVEGLRDIDDGMERVGQSARRLRRLLATTFTVVGAGLFLRHLRIISDQFIAIRNRVGIAVDALGGDFRETAGTIDRLRRIALETRAPFAQITELFQRMSIASRELGANQEDLFVAVRAVAHGLAIQGAETGTARGALLQLSQAMGSAIVRAEEFNSIMEGGFPIALAVARGIDRAGGSVARLRTLIINGQVTNREFFQALKSQAPELARTFLTTTATIAQALEVLRTQMIGFVGNASQVSAAFAQAIKSIGENLDGLVLSAATAGSVLIAPFAAARIRGLLAWVAAMAAATRQLYAFGGAAAVASAGVNALYGPIGLVTAALGAGAAAWFFWSRSTAEASDSAANLIEQLRSIANELNSSTTAVSPQQQVIRRAENEYSRLVDQRQRLLRLADSLQGERGFTDRHIDELVQAADRLIPRIEKYRSALDRVYNASRRQQQQNDDNAVGVTRFNTSLENGARNARRFGQALNDSFSNAAVALETENRLIRLGASEYERRVALATREAQRRLDARRSAVQDEIIQRRAHADRLRGFLAIAEAQREQAQFGSEAQREAARQVRAIDKAVVRERQRLVVLEDELRTLQGIRVNTNAIARAEAARERQRRSSAVDELRGSLESTDPVGAAQRQLAQGIRTIREAREESIITDREALKLQEQLRRSLQEQLDPLQAFLDATAEAVRLRRGTAAERRLEIQTAQVANELREQGADIGERATAVIRSRIVATVAANRELQAEEEALRRIQDPADGYRMQIEAINRVVQQHPALAARAAAAIRDLQLAMLDAQTDARSGIERGLMRLQRDVVDFAALAERAVTNSFQNMEDALVSFVATGKLDIKNLVDSIIADFARLVIRQTITAPLLSALSGALGAGGNAEGGLIHGPGTGTSDSILARVSNREYIVNARSTERFLPLLEAINNAPAFQYGGQVGGQSPTPGRNGSPPVLVQVIQQTQAGGNAPPPEVQRRTGPDGQSVIRVLIRDTTRELINNGEFDQSFSGRFGAKPLLR